MYRDACKIVQNMALDPPRGSKVHTPQSHKILWGNTVEIVNKSNLLGTIHNWERNLLFHYVYMHMHHIHYSS